MKNLLNKTVPLLISVMIPLNVWGQSTQEIPDDLYNQPLEPGLLQTIQDALPEGTNVNANFLNPTYNPNLPLQLDASVSVTFVDEGAGYRNSLGYFTFQDGAFDGLNKGDIDTDGVRGISLNELQNATDVETGWVFPNASKAGAGGLLQAGDTINLAGGETFSAGTNIGFFLVQNGWTGSGVKGIDDNNQPQVMYTLDFLNPEADQSSTINQTIGDKTRHVAMLFADEGRTDIIMGFEDLNRIAQNENDWNIRSDEDFNDAVFIVRADPAEAFQGANIATAPAPVAGGGLLSLFLMGCLFFQSQKQKLQPLLQPIT
ncbi:DUF4114 domain-containing protein, partial [Magnetococcales bacterium HHB-1]